MLVKKPLLEEVFLAVKNKKDLLFYSLKRLKIADY